MSWWISLCDAQGCTPEVERFTGGGTFMAGGSDEADLNVTYNYGGHFKFKALHGRRAGDTVAELREAAERLGTERADDYWEASPGDAEHACALLLRWAEQHPGCAWVVDCEKTLGPYEPPELPRGRPPWRNLSGRPEREKTDLDQIAREMEGALGRRPRPRPPRRVAAAPAGVGRVAALEEQPRAVLRLPHVQRLPGIPKDEAMRIIKISGRDERGWPTGWTFDVGGGDVEMADDRLCCLFLPADGKVLVGGGTGIEIAEWTEARRKAMGHGQPRVS